MNSEISDVEVCRKISKNLYSEYSNALEFITLNPDYSLLKLRESTEIIVDLISEKKQLKVKNYSLFHKVNALFESQIISYSTKGKFHEIRKLCNSGVHKNLAFEGSKEFYEGVMEKLKQSAKKSRDIFITLLEDVSSIFLKENFRKIVSAKITGREEKEIMFEASISLCDRMKFKAGIVCESIFKKQQFDAPLIMGLSFVYHIQSLIKSALGFYEASYKISANVKEFEIFSGDKDENQLVLERCSLEALYRYAALAIGFDEDEKIKNKGLHNLKIAADRGYAPAEALYGARLYEEKNFDLSLSYLKNASSKDEVLALRFLYYYYSDGGACQKNIELALANLEKAVGLGCPDALAVLAGVYHRGEFVTKNLDRAKTLLEESIEKGSAIGKRYYIVEFNDLAGKVADEFQAFGDKLMLAIDQLKPKPYRSETKIGANEKCPCGSGLKYKKCCRDRPNKKMQVTSTPYLL